MVFVGRLMVKFDIYLIENITNWLNEASICGHRPRLLDNDWMMTKTWLTHNYR